MSDLPCAPVRSDLGDRLLAAFDGEGKIRNAVVAYVLPDGADVVLLGESPAFAAVLRDAGARRVDVVAREAGAGAVVLSDPAAADALGSLSRSSVDAVVALWTSFAPPAPGALAAARTALRPGGRLVVVHDYGRDDLDGLRGPARAAELVAWSRRDGWLLRAGFRIHVVHAFWRIDGVDEAAELLGAAYGRPADEVAATFRRPRISHNVAVYHLTTPSDTPTDEPPAGSGVKHAG